MQSIAPLPMQGQAMCRLYKPAQTGGAIAEMEIAFPRKGEAALGGWGGLKIQT